MELNKLEKAFKLNNFNTEDDKNPLSFRHCETLIGES